MFNTIDEAKQTNQESDHHWFDADTMAFFRSQVESDLVTLRDDRQFFISSEQFVDGQGNPDPRRFTLREIKPDGHVSTFGDFQAFPTKEDALDSLWQEQERAWSEATDAWVNQ